MGLLLESNYLLADEADSNKCDAFYCLEIILYERKFFWINSQKLQLETLFTNAPDNGAAYYPGINSN